MTPAGDLGPNAGVVEDLYRRYAENPDSVSEAWRDFFADYTPGPEPAPPVPERAAVEPAAPVPHSAVASEADVPESPEERREADTTTITGDDAAPLRGAAARVVENMEASLEVPTATSVRTVPAKLLEINRLILNNQLRRLGHAKVSFTHLIAYAVVQAVSRVPAMNSTYGLIDGKPGVSRNKHVNLGIAVDVEKRDGTRSLLVPNIAEAETLDFAGFVGSYEELIRRVRSGKLSPDDFIGTTISITNPGMIGTEHSVPRLMPDQALIVGVGSIAYPSEYEGADTSALARIGVSKTVTLTSTYDHRVIQGAQSGEFLRWVHELLLGAEGFYDGCFTSFGVPYEPARWKEDVSPPPDSVAAHEKSVHVQQLINMYRVRGHLIANLDPLGYTAARTHPELDPDHWGLTIWDLDREFATGGLAGRRAMLLRDILGVLRDAYARTIGVEYMHIQESDQKEWIQEHVEGESPDPSLDTKRRILDRLNAAEAFEAFLQRKFLGHKRFSLEGAESLIPMLDALLDSAADAGCPEVVMGMAHRGRLNVLANTLGKSYTQIFREFEGELDPDAPQGSGDVKYHLGTTGEHESAEGNSLTVRLASNPSHLEAVDPVVEGMARARRDELEAGHDDVVPVLIHGDAAFAGQGVVAETLNLSELPGYDVGGTVHIVVNNQLGFTTDPEHGRSSIYATDVAKMVQAPILHVNGDDPEACVRVVNLAFEFRQRFDKDVVVDMVCYRRYGHNETDEPAFTQPRMYERIDAHRSIRKLYTETLVNRGDITLDEAESALEAFSGILEGAFRELEAGIEATGGSDEAGTADHDDPVADDRPTAVDRERLDDIVTALTTWPDGFSPHDKLARLITKRREAFDADRVDWALAESLAFGSLVTDGIPVRLAGQDTRRGTFSQRHGVLVDKQTEEEYIPLAHISDFQAPMRLYDSLLSEYAALGFEYGYSVATSDSWVGWEAQFGDFANGGQITIDQFIAAAEDKWDQRSSLTLLLPHGYEGQGPEHSSARLERFLILAADGNMRIAYPTTAAQYFHVLRRQACSGRRTPLVCITPKRYLRMPGTISPVEDLTSGGFREVLDDDGAPTEVSRVLLCTGKIAHELREERDERSAPVAVVRLEQLYPFPTEQLLATLGKYRGSVELRWVQEEPENMGAWGFVRGRMIDRMGAGTDVAVVARPPSGSPATGSARVHELEQQAVIDAALA
ncbi:MAG: multifunctional oxoglutarate decarboxylase/oxoglutarate dehydrogenase thiamine pyrophosphate-binding subunit/dihydrolipoyllysine-residue succinyltransferase subunit [Acidimicrobiia bacterium]